MREVRRLVTLAASRGIDALVQGEIRHRQGAHLRARSTR